MNSFYVKGLIISILLCVITSCSNKDVIFDKLEGFYPMRFQKLNEEGGTSISISLPFNQNNLSHFVAGNIKAVRYLSSKVDDNPITTGPQPIRFGIMELYEWENDKITVHASFASASDGIFIKYFIKSK